MHLDQSRTSRTHHLQFFYVYASINDNVKDKWINQHKVIAKQLKVFINSSFGCSCNCCTQILYLATQATFVKGMEFYAKTNKNNNNNNKNNTPSNSIQGVAAATTSQLTQSNTQFHSSVSVQHPHAAVCTICTICMQHLLGVRHMLNLKK